MEAKKLLEVVQLEGQHEDESCLTFVLNGEDHTLGNSLRYMIMKNPEVNFCGYNIPHPSENKINLRIQTKEDISAKDVFRIGLDNLNRLSEHVISTFETSVGQFKKMREEQGGKDDVEMESDESEEESDN
eukprot:gene7505-8336_t